MKHERTVQRICMLISGLQGLIQCTCRSAHKTSDQHVAIHVAPVLYDVPRVGDSHIKVTGVIGNFEKNLQKVNI